MKLPSLHFALNAGYQSSFSHRTLISDPFDVTKYSRPIFPPTVMPSSFPEAIPG
jgi:hypothetical protein